MSYDKEKIKQINKHKAPCKYCTNKVGCSNPTFCLYWRMFKRMLEKEHAKE